MSDETRVCNCSQCGVEIVLPRDKDYGRIKGRPWCSDCLRVARPSSMPNSRVEQQEIDYHGGRFYGGEW